MSQSKLIDRMYVYRTVRNRKLKTQNLSYSFLYYSLFLFILCFKFFSIHFYTQKQRKTKINWKEKNNCNITFAKSRQPKETETSWQSFTLEGSRPKVEWVTISVNSKGLRNDYHSFIVIFEDQCKVIFPELDRWPGTILSYIISINYKRHLIDQVPYSQHYAQSDQNAVFTFHGFLIFLPAVC